MTTIEKNGSLLSIDRGMSNVIYIFQNQLAAVRVDNSKSKIHMMTAAYIRNSDFTVLDFDDIESPVFASFAEMVQYVLDFADSDVGEFSFVASAADAGSDSIDVSAYDWGSISQVFLNNAFIPAADWTLSSGTLSFDVNVDEGDNITIYA